MRSSKRELAAAQPYAAWVRSNLVDIDDLLLVLYLPRLGQAPIAERQRMFGYTDEDSRVILGPMATAGEEPSDPLGTDSALAVLSNRSRLLYDYFKQTFAQVTICCSTQSARSSSRRWRRRWGRKQSARPATGVVPADSDRYPVIDNEQLARLKHVYLPAFRSTTIQAVFDPLRRRRPRARARRGQAARDRGHRRGLHDRHPGRIRGADRHLAPIDNSRHGGGAPPSRASRHTHALRPRRRVG